MRGTLERVGDQARLFRTRHQTLCLFHIGTSWYFERCAYAELGELADTLDSIENTLDVTPKRDPGELRRPRDCLKIENEAVGDRSDEQRLRRPLIARTAELRGRRRSQGRESVALEADIALGVGERRDGIAMGEFLHMMSVLPVVENSRV